ncbi:MAG TPA: cytosine permease [Oculatellaceae cyanobacterium]
MIDSGQGHDDFSKSPVNDANLRPWWYLLIIEMGVMISIPIFVVGGQLGLGLTFRDLVIATFLGAGILGVIGGLTARLGAITRCSTALIARATFGRKGAACISLLLALGMTGWWGVQTEMFAGAVVQLSKQLFNVGLPQEVMIAVGGAAMITTAALGIKAIGRLSYLAVPLLILGLVYAVATIFRDGAASSVFHHQPVTQSALTIGAAAATVAGGFIVGASMNPDYSRFARNQFHALGYSVSDYALIYPLLLSVCGFIAIAYQSTDIMVHLVPTSLSWLVFLMMMFATWAANDCNLYSSSLSLAAILPRWRRSRLAIMAGLFGIILAELHVCGHMVSFLTLLGILIAPISGVFVINALDRKSAMTETELSAIPDWRPAQLVAWFTGALIGYMATPTNSLGLGLVTLTTIPTLDSVLAASIAMLMIRLIARCARSSSQLLLPPSLWLYAAPPGNDDQQ